MARSHFWQYVLNSEGQPVSGAIIQLYAEPMSVDPQPVYLYTSPDAIQKSQYVQTDNNGFFEFWILDKNESLTDGFNTNKTFTMVIGGGTFEERIITNMKFLFEPPKIFSDSLFTTFTESPSGTYEIEITHNLNTNYPMVQVYDMNTKLVIPAIIESIDANTLSIIVELDDSELEEIPVSVIVIGVDK